jgi:hypothetical protein
VDNWKEFRFKIDGEIDGVKITPYTMPLARLALYLVDLAQLLGHNGSVHLLKVDEGSAEPVFFVDPEEESRIIHQIRNAQKGMGPRNANRAYKKLDSKLRHDNATGRIFDAAEKAEIIEFPGNRANLPEIYENIRERASVTGELKRVGGFDNTIPIHLLRNDGAILYCEADEHIAQQLASRFYAKVVRIHGIATYSRGNEGKWKMENFKIQSFDEAPLIDESFIETMEKLRAIDGNEWAEVADPLGELRKLRHGEEMTK